MAQVRQSAIVQEQEEGRVLRFVPQSYQDVRFALTQMHNRHLVLLDISKMPGQELRRCLDYLAGFSDCCNATLVKVSDHMMLVAPVKVQFTDLTDSFSFE